MYVQSLQLRQGSTLAENLYRLQIVGAPSFFPTVWGWVKRWFDPITVSKIFILSPNNVYQTLSQYMDHDNIPVKYGGGLDFSWTQMPSLEPEIEAQIKWENPAIENGRKTIPIGPMKWEAGSNGEMQAWAVGHENGKPRRTLVFTIPSPVGYNRVGAPVSNIPAHQVDDPLTTVGTHTHPHTDESAIDHDSPPSDSPTSSESHAASSIPAQTTLPIRTGTSETRYEQQNVTHASGQLSEGTPHAATIDHGGDKHVVVEPNTVGQAAKEMPMPEPEQPAPGYVDQAKQAATQASAAVTSAAGAVYGAVSGSGEKEQPTQESAQSKSPEEQRLDSQIDASKDQDVEEFLRAQNKSVN